MGAKIDSKVELGLAMFEIGGWKILQLSNSFSNRKLLGEFIEEAVAALSSAILSRDSYLVMHHVKELMSPREGLREMVQCYRRQHFAASKTSRRTNIVERICEEEIQEHSDEYSKIRSEPSLPHGFKKTRVILIHLENYLEVLVHERHAEEIWDRNWMNIDMHNMRLDVNLLNAMLFNMYNPILMETILKKDDHWNTVILIPETLLEWEAILEDRGGFL